jgi:hypothetical protein
MAMRDYSEEALLQKLNQYPLFSGSFGPSLQQRINKPNWFENRFIQAIFRDTSWVEEHEQLLARADIKKVKNWDSIFGCLDGSKPYYDLRVFDVLAEVRLILWARENGYTYIEKLLLNNQPTPDFRMRKGEEITLAEAKHFRARDFLPDFVEDRLKGLRFKTGCLTHFGIFADITDEYGRIRDFLLETRRLCESAYQAAIRDEVTEEWLKTLEHTLTNDPRRELKIIFNLFVIRRVKIPCETSVGLFGPHKNGGDAAELMLKKLCGNLMDALKQINSFINRNPSGEYPSRALVFLSGTSSWSEEWNNMWEMLESQDSTIWEKVKEIHTKASGLIRIPFELIIGKDKEDETEFAGRTATKKTLKYVPFPWIPER